MTKGLETRERILDTAFRMAARDGLEGVSFSTLASELGLSKSGLFAHFKSKEELQLEMLRTASQHFVDQIMTPAFKERRGLPRLNALFDNWIRWASDPDLPGGCIFVAASTEFDDHEGRVRDFVVEQQHLLLQTIARAVSLCIETGDFRKDLDVEQFAFEFLGVYLAFHEARRLLRDPRAEKRVRKAFARLIEAASAAN